METDFFKSLDENEDGVLAEDEIREVSCIFQGGYQIDANPKSDQIRSDQTGPDRVNCEPIVLRGVGLIQFGLDRVGLC